MHHAQTVCSSNWLVIQSLILLQRMREDAGGGTNTIYTMKIIQSDQISSDVSLRTCALSGVTRKLL